MDPLGNRLRPTARVPSSVVRTCHEQHLPFECAGLTIGPAIIGDAQTGQLGTWRRRAADKKPLGWCMAMRPA